MTIDCDFPGGNILLVSRTEDALMLRPDLRDTTQPWFYWHFRVRGAAGRSVTFSFDTPECVVGALGPVVSLNGGSNWQWLGAEAISGNGFHFRFPPEALEVRFAVAFPYLQANLEDFLIRHRSCASLIRETLCLTASGREAEVLRTGCLTGEPRTRVLLTARHHACESMASFVLEGLLEATLAEEGAWLRDNVEFLAVPFVDKDGVEQGDQGKARGPHDHNRDYLDQPPLYLTVAAIKRLVPAWSSGKLRVHLDLHCPCLRGADHEEISFVGSPDPSGWRSAQAFARLLREHQRGPLVYTGACDLAYGEGWNAGMEGQTATTWASALVTGGFAATLEIPYALAHGTPVTPDSARAFGRDLATALAGYLA